MADQMGNDGWSKQGMDDTMIDRNGSVEPAEMVVLDIVTRLREQAKAPALAWLTEAADRIDYLHTLVVELLPFMFADSIAGVAMSAPPEGHQRDDCDDCDWYYGSLEWRKRVDSGEFDGYFGNAK